MIVSISYDTIRKNKKLDEFTDKSGVEKNEKDEDEIL